MDAPAICNKFRQLERPILELPWRSEGAQVTWPVAQNSRSKQTKDESQAARLLGECHIDL